MSPSPKKSEEGLPAGDAHPERHVCGICGQSYDRRRFNEVYHHNEEPHEPLPPGALIVHPA